jgi:glycerophosphoryl diester phosphodiesterase
VAEVRRLGLVERTFVSGFYRRALRDMRRREPGIRTGITFPRDLLRVHGKKGSGGLERVFLGAMRAITPWLVRPLLLGTGASALVLHHSVVGPAVVRRAHARGLAVVAWTVDDPLDLARVDAAGVDAVVSNDPRIFLSTLSA